ncbi:N-succinylarginine dihydrolase [soil metagenome]
MWAANAATVTPSHDSGDGRVKLTPANLLTNLHRSLEAGQTARALRRLLPDAARFDVRDPLPAHADFADEGAANHVRLSARSAGEPGVELFAWSRDAAEPWTGAKPGRQTRQASEAVARAHGSQRPVFARQSRAAVEAGAFHNDVVCVGSGPVLFFHELAFDDCDTVERDIRRAADGLFEPEFRRVSERELSLSDAISTYLFNSMLVRPSGGDRFLLIAPVEVSEHARARAVAERLVEANGAIGGIEYVDVRQSMRNGGGPACLRLRLALTSDELAAVNPAQRFDADLHARLSGWVERRYRDRLTPADLADPELLRESREALDELCGVLNLGADFYPFQREHRAG